MKSWRIITCPLCTVTIRVPAVDYDVDLRLICLPCPHRNWRARFRQIDQRNLDDLAKAVPLQIPAQLPDLGPSA